MTSRRFAVYVLPYIFAIVWAGIGMALIGGWVGALVALVGLVASSVAWLWRYV